jgi:hypothetical protein
MAPASAGTTGSASTTPEFRVLTVRPLSGGGCQSR